MIRTTPLARPAAALVAALALALSVLAGLSITPSAAAPAAATGVGSADDVLPAEREARNAIVLGDDTVAPRRRGETRKPRGTKKVLVLGAYWGTPTPPATPTATDFANVIAQADAWVRGVSGGQLGWRLTGVQDWVRLPGEGRGGCDRSYPQLLRQAIRKSKAAKQVRRADHVMIYLPCEVPTADGRGEQPGKFVWLFGPEALNLHVVAHELLHNYGIRHANALQCTSNGVQTSFGKCTQMEYGDLWDRMGDGANLGAAFRSQLGWLGKKSITRMRRSGTVALSPLGSLVGTQAITIRTRKRTYWIEHHPEQGYPPYGPAGSVQVKLEKGDNVGLIDATPGSAPDVGGSNNWRVPDAVDGNLAPGMSLALPEGIVVTTLAADAGSATVQVTMPKNKKKKKKGKKKRR